jgi:hypothetical protein
VSRRASASYAWEYQKRRNKPRADASNSSNSGASSSRQAYHEFGTGGFSSSASARAGPSTLFEQFAARERKKDAATAARLNESGKVGASNNINGGFMSREEHEAHTSGGFLRFCQVGGIFYLMFYISTKLGSTGETKKKVGASASR